MVNFTSNTYTLKREILTFSNKISKRFSKPDRKFTKVFFCYYRLAKGIRGILSYAKEGVRLWFRTKRPRYRQLCLKLVI